MSSKSFTDEISAIYTDSVGPDRIYPFVGRAFDPEAPRALLLLAVGINAYVDDKDLPKVGVESAGWFPAWFREQKWPFQRGVLADASALGAALERPGRPFRGVDSIYLTNAVKRFLSRAAGRYQSVSPEEFGSSAPIWRAELRLMHSRDVLPDAIVIFGEVWWEHAWRSFHPAPKDRASALVLPVLDYQTTPGELFHYVNRIELSSSRGTHRMLLVRAAHPAAATPTWTGAAIARHADFRSAAEWQQAAP